MLDEVVGKRERCKQEQKKEETAFLIEGAEQLQKAVCCGFFEKVSVCEVKVGLASCLFRQCGNVSAA